MTTVRVTPSQAIVSNRNHQHAGQSKRLSRPNSNGTDTADNATLTFNLDQTDSDLDGIGDTCDPQTGPPRNKEQCRNGGWMRFDFPRRFRNQGDCIQFVNTGR